MSETVVKVKVQDLFSVLHEFLENGQNFKMTVTGNSMMPFLREGKDAVLISKESYSNIKRHDIVLIQRDNGEYVMHRVLKKSAESFYMVGDAQCRVEGPLRPDQLRGIIRSIYRNGRCISVEHKGYKMLAVLWQTLHPVRGIIFKLHKGAQLCVKTIKKN